MKFTPENITHLEPNQIFCYGANAAGIHGAGAAKLALRWGAKMGQYGLVGQTYGIPTKDKKINTLPLDKIQVHVDTFLATAFSHPEYEFLVTKIGCGLALYQPKDIAPLFKMIKNLLKLSILYNLSILLFPGGLLNYSLMQLIFYNDCWQWIDADEVIPFTMLIE